MPSCIRVRTGRSSGTAARPFNDCVRMAMREGTQRIPSLSQPRLTSRSEHRGLGGGRKIPSGALGMFSLGSENADVALHLVVIGCDVPISERPIVAASVAGARAEIRLGEAQSDAAPVIRPAAHNARAEPHELGTRRLGVRFALNIPETVRGQELRLGDNHGCPRRRFRPRDAPIRRARRAPCNPSPGGPSVRLPASPRSARLPSTPWRPAPPAAPEPMTHTSYTFPERMISNIDG